MAKNILSTQVGKTMAWWRCGDAGRAARSFDCAACPGGL